MKFILTVLSIHLMASVSSASCASLSGRDYDRCCVYAEGSSCAILSGRDYDMCKVYRDGVSSSLLSGKDCENCQILKLIQADANL